MTLAHLIHRKEGYERQSKDYDFSRLSMEEHWASGARDVKRTLEHPAWRKRKVEHEGLNVFDLGGENHRKMRMEEIS